MRRIRIGNKEGMIGCCNDRPQRRKLLTGAERASTCGSGGEPRVVLVRRQGEGTETRQLVWSQPLELPGFQPVAGWQRHRSASMREPTATLSSPLTPSASASPPSPQQAALHTLPSRSSTPAPTLPTSPPPGALLLLLLLLRRRRTRQTLAWTGGRRPGGRGSRPRVRWGWRWVRHQSRLPGGPGCGMPQRGTRAATERELGGACEGRKESGCAGGDESRASDVRHFEKHHKQLELPEYLGCVVSPRVLGILPAEEGSASGQGLAAQGSKLTR